MESSGSTELRLSLNTLVSQFGNGDLEGLPDPMAAVAESESIGVHVLLFLYGHS